jgi:hypothetical protein
MSDLPNQPNYTADPTQRLTGETKSQEGEVSVVQPDRFKICLEGESADSYLTVLRRLIQMARTNQYFPSPKGQDNLYRLMSPQTNFGLDNKIRLNDLNGMPSEPDIGRVLADKEAGRRFLAMNDNADILSRTDPAALRLQKRILYYRDVEKSELPKRVNLEMKLRSLDHNAKVAQFYSIFERYDPGEGIFTRYTIQLSHRHTRWNQPQIELAGDDLSATTEFRNVISCYHSDEAEFAFILLSEVPSITVEEVVRGRVGPLWFHQSNAPEEIKELLNKHPGDFILNLPLERVGVLGKDQADKSDLNNDPFGRLYRPSLAPAAREIADEKAASLGYRVYKERKFCCTKGIAGPLKSLLESRGCRCIIYTI